MRLCMAVWSGQYWCDLLLAGRVLWLIQVDCFSFGMFIYELVMLKLPYEGSASLTGSNINIRSHVLSGGRPPITTKVQL